MDNVQCGHYPSHTSQCCPFLFVPSQWCQSSSQWHKRKPPAVKETTIDNSGLILQKDILAGSPRALTTSTFSNPLWLAAIFIASKFS